MKAFFKSVLKTALCLLSLTLAKNLKSQEPAPDIKAGISCATSIKWMGDLPPISLHASVKIYEDLSPGFFSKALTTLLANPDFLRELLNKKDRQLTHIEFKKGAPFQSNGAGTELHFTATPYFIMDRGRYITAKDFPFSITVPSAELISELLAFLANHYTVDLPADLQALLLASRTLGAQAEHSAFSRIIFSVPSALEDTLAGWKTTSVSKITTYSGERPAFKFLESLPGKYSPLVTQLNEILEEGRLKHIVIHENKKSGKAPWSFSIHAFIDPPDLEGNESSWRLDFYFK
jgi:hypothetical protein